MMIILVLSAVLLLVDTIAFIWIMGVYWEASVFYIPLELPIEFLLALFLVSLFSIRIYSSFTGYFLTLRGYFQQPIVWLLIAIGLKLYVLSLYITAIFFSSLAIANTSFVFVLSVLLGLVVVSATDRISSRSQLV